MGLTIIINDNSIHTTDITGYALERTCRDLSRKHIYVRAKANDPNQAYFEEVRMDAFWYWMAISYKIRPSTANQLLYTLYGKAICENNYTFSGPLKKISFEDFCKTFKNLAENLECIYIKT